MAEVYFLDGTLFAEDFIRIVHGGRGDYMELEKEQIKVNLISKYGQPLPSHVPNGEDFFYYYLIPEGRDEKVYWQVKKVSYADYKVGRYYIDPKLVEIREIKDLSQLKLEF
jgi:hypothetical protein